MIHTSRELAHLNNGLQFNTPNHISILLLLLLCTIIYTRSFFFSKWSKARWVVRVPAIVGQRRIDWRHLGAAVRLGGQKWWLFFLLGWGGKGAARHFFFFNKKKGLWYFQISSNIYVDTSYYVCCDKETVRRVSDRSSKIQLDILCPVPYVYDETDVLHLFVYLLCVRAMTYFKRFFGPSGGKPNETPIYLAITYSTYYDRINHWLVTFSLARSSPPGSRDGGWTYTQYMYRSTTMYVPPVGVIWHACVPARSSCTLFAWRTLAARLSHYVDRGWWELTSVVL